MQKAIEEHINALENMKNKEDELMCFIVVILSN